MPRSTTVLANLILFAFLLGGSAPPASSQGLLKISQGSGQVGVSFEGLWAGDAEGSGTGNTAVSEWLSLPYTGSLVDPRILRFSFMLKPRFSQRRADDLPNPINSRSLDMVVGGKLLSSQPLTLSFDLSRAAGSTSGGFGTNSDFKNSNLTTVLKHRNSWLPGSLRYSKRTTHNVSTVGLGLVPFEQVYDTKTLRFLAENRKIRIEVGRVEHEDHVGDADHITRNLRLGHRLQWGKGSSLHTLYNSVDRTRNLSHARWAWRERLHVQHTKTTETALLLEKTRSKNGSLEFDNLLFSATVSSQVRKSVSLGVSGSTSNLSSTFGRQSAKSVAPSTGVSLALPFKARLNGSLSAGFENRSRENGIGAVHVLNESMQIDPTGTLTIARAGVDAATIIVTSTDESTIYLEGLDFGIVSVGSFVEIRILPGGRLSPGETVLISYQVEVDLSGKESSVFWRYSLSLRVRGLSAGHRQSSRNRNARESETRRDLADYDESSTEVKFSHSFRGWDLRTGLSQRRRRSRVIDYVTYEANAGFLIPTIRRVRFHMDASGRITEEGQNRLKSLAVRPGIDWIIARSLSTRGALTYRFWTDGIFDETTLGVEVDVSWRVASLETVFRFAHERHKFRQVRIGDRATVRLLRSF